jgi:hypothetical protein
MALRREDKIRFEAVGWLEDSANWNKRVEGAPVVLGKNVAVVALDDAHTWCLTDADLLEIIKWHILADKINVQLIKSGKAGLVKHPEMMLEDKIKALFERLRPVDDAEVCKR